MASGAHTVVVEWKDRGTMVFQVRRDFMTIVRRWYLGRGEVGLLHVGRGETATP